MNVPHQVLIVDDDQMVRGLLRVILEGQGYGVSHATNGEEALHFLTDHAPSLIVLDLEMPVMDGSSCYRALRSRGVAAPVLILSAAEAMTVAEELGADAALGKPFDVLHLTALVSQLVSPDVPGSRASASQPAA